MEKRERDEVGRYEREQEDKQEVKWLMAWKSTRKRGMVELIRTDIAKLGEVRGREDQQKQ